MKKKIKKISEKERIERLFEDKAIIHLDLGCGENKQPGMIGVDFRNVKGADIHQDLSLFPWKNIPSEIADVVYSSHLLEHINPDPANPQLAELIDLLLSKKLVTAEEIRSTVGDYRFLGGFVRFMDEVWRITKPGGQFISTFPFGGSPGFLQDPSHLNNITPVTLAYFSPFAKVNGTGPYYNLYNIYRPKPWKILRCFYDQQGFVEVALEKMRIDKSFKISNDNGMSA